MKFNYTEAGARELNIFLRNQQRELEKLLLDKKQLLGDDVLEVTASDVRESGALIRPRPPAYRSVDKLRLLGATYSLVGLIGLFVGIFFKEIKSLFVGDPFQLMLVLSGALFLALGLFAGIIAKLRKQQLVGKRDAENYLAYVDDAVAAGSVDQFPLDAAANPSYGQSNSDVVMVVTHDSGDRPWRLIRDGRTLGLFTKRQDAINEAERYARELLSARRASRVLVDKEDGSQEFELVYTTTAPSTTISAQARVSS